MKLFRVDVFVYVTAENEEEASEKVQEGLDKGMSEYDCEVFDASLYGPEWIYGPEWESLAELSRQHGISPLFLIPNIP